MNTDSGCSRMEEGALAFTTSVKGRGSSSSVSLCSVVYA
jgi:hypothetical protein